MERMLAREHKRMHSQVRYLGRLGGVFLFSCFLSLDVGGLAVVMEVPVVLVLGALASVNNSDRSRSR